MMKIWMLHTLCAVALDHKLSICYMDHYPQTHSHRSAIVEKKKVFFILTVISVMSNTLCLVYVILDRSTCCQKKFN